MTKVSTTPVLPTGWAPIQTSHGYGHPPSVFPLPLPHAPVLVRSSLTAIPKAQHMQNWTPLGALALAAKTLLIASALLTSEASAQQTQEVHTSIQATVAYRHHPSFPVDGAPVRVRAAVGGALLFEGGTTNNGQTPAFNSQALSEIEITLGETRLSLPTDLPFHDGHTVGKIVNHQVAINFMADKINAFTQVISQPFARKVLHYSHTSAPRYFPLDNPWWSITVAPGLGLVFNLEVAPLVNMTDIDGVFRYLSGGAAPHEYIQGVYISATDIDIGSGALLLHMFANGRAIPSTLIADVFVFSNDANPTLAAEVAAVQPNEAFAVPLSGRFSRGKTLILFRDGVSGPPPIEAPGIGSGSSQPITLGGSAAAVQILCGTCDLGPSQATLDTLALSGTCIPPAPPQNSCNDMQGDAFITRKAYGATTGSIFESFPNMPLTPNYNSSTSNSVTIEFPLGPEAKLGGTVTETVGEVVGTELGDGEFGCGQRAQVFVSKKFGSREFTGHRGGWVMNPGYTPNPFTLHYEPCAHDYSITTHCRDDGSTTSILRCDKEPLAVGQQ
jgi:hypothetical protein